MLLEAELRRRSVLRPTIPTPAVGTGRHLGLNTALTALGGGRGTHRGSTAAAGAGTGTVPLPGGGTQSVHSTAAPHQMPGYQQAAAGIRHTPIQRHQPASLPASRRVPNVGQLRSTAGNPGQRSQTGPTSGVRGARPARPLVSEEPGWPDLWCQRRRQH